MLLQHPAHGLAASAAQGYIAAVSYTHLLRQAVHEELELILVGQNAGGQQLLHQLEY